MRPLGIKTRFENEAKGNLVIATLNEYPLKCELHLSNWA